MKSAAFSCLFFIIIGNTFCQHESYEDIDAGEICLIRNSAVLGTCRLLPDCPSVVRNLPKVHPQMCGFEGIVPIVCCLDNSTAAESTLFSNEAVITTTNSGLIGGIAKLKCKEYEEIVVSPPMMLPNSIPIKYCPQDQAPLTVGSNSALSKQFPHMAAIGFDGKNKKKIWDCSGSLISEQFVLTSARCLYHEIYGEPKYVRIGDLVLNREDDDAKPQQFNIAASFAHPNYKESYEYHDIALLKLDKPAQFNKYVKPACVGTDQNFTKPDALTSGWGSFDHNDNNYQWMLYHPFQHITSKKCYAKLEQSVREQLKNGIVDELQLCAESSSKYGCEGNHGAPLQTFSAGPCMYTVVGVTSFQKPCGPTNIPAVYTRVSRYIEWIEKIVWP